MTDDKTIHVDRETGEEIVPVAQGETAIAASAAQAQARVQAQYLMALKRPRDIDMARQRLLKECKRPGFAEVAIYSKPVGGGSVEGPSIRFAEAAVRAMGNIDITAPTLFEDDTKRIVRITATDLETNASWSQDVALSKTVERRKLKRGQVALATRLNSYGDQIFILPATDDEMNNKVQAAISKASRTLGLRLLPGDIQEECLNQCRKTLADQAKGDPDAEKKKVIDAFDTINVGVADLKKYLGHPVEQTSPKELVDLRKVFMAIKDEQTTWAAVMEERFGKPPDDDEEEEGDTKKKPENMDDLKRSMK